MAGRAGAMTEVEIALAGLVAALLGVGGGIWAGARGRVAETTCDLKHQGLRGVLEEIRADLVEIKGDTKAVYSRVTATEGRISRMEGILNGPE